MNQILSNAIKSACRQSVRDIDEVIRIGLDMKLGRGWKTEDLIGRCKKTTRSDSSEVYFIDDKPFLELYPPEVSITDVNSTVKRSYRYL